MQIMKKQEKYRSVKHNFKIVTSILSWTVFVLLLIVAGLLVYYFIATKIYANKGDNYKPAFGLYTIVSPSMEPNLKIYDVIVNVNVNDPDDIQVGDVITFVSTSAISKGMTITHRVVAIQDGPEGREYQTKGDNNLSPDNSPALYSNVLGKVVLKIPQLGRLQSFLATRGGWLIVVVIPAVLIILNDILKLFRLKGAQKDIEEVAILTKKKQQEEQEKKKAIEDHLIKTFKPKRSIYESDPLKKDSVIISVESKKDSNIEKDLPKLKGEANCTPSKTAKRTRKRKKNTKNG